MPVPFDLSELPIAVHAAAPGAPASSVWPDMTRRAALLCIVPGYQSERHHAICRASWVLAQAMRACRGVQS